MRNIFQTILGEIWLALSEVGLSLTYCDKHYGLLEDNMDNVYQTDAAFE